MGEKHGKNSFEHQEEKQEFSFTEGVSHALALIQDKLNKKDIIFVGIAGSNIDVGKSELRRALVRELERQRLPFTVANNADDGSLQSSLKDSIPYQQEFYQSSHCVIIIEQAWIGDTINRQLANASLRRSDPARSSGYDIIIGIYRPDKPFINTLGADMVIRNDAAVDKKPIPKK